MAQRLVGARQMAAGDMAGLVGDDADELIGRLAAQDRAAVHEQVLAAGDEGVEGRVVDDVDMNRGRIEAGRGEDWRRVGADDIFDLGIAQDADVLGPGATRQDHARRQQHAENPR